jgi:Fic family protein
MTTNLLQSIKNKQEKLTAKLGAKPISKGKLNRYFELEFIYNSLKISSDSLSRSEIIKITKSGLTIENKNLIVQQKAINLQRAFKKTVKLANTNDLKLSNRELIEVYSTLSQGISNSKSNGYRQKPAKDSETKRNYPPPDNIERLISGYFGWLNELSNQLIIKNIGNIHYGISLIRPFNQRNQQLARLITSYMLLKNNLPPLIIPEEKIDNYHRAINKGHNGNLESLNKILTESVFSTLSSSLDQLKSKDSQEAFPLADMKSKLLKIGQLADKTGETVPTIRYWTKRRLLLTSGETKGGYMLYSQKMIERAKRIRKLQEKRLTLDEIRELFIQENEQL